MSGTVARGTGGVAIVSPGYPGVPGGVTAHTARLVRHWREAGRRVEVLGSAAEPPARVVGGWVEAGLRAVLLQYVPFLWGRRGLSRYPARLARVARAAGLRVGVFVHEPWVPPTRLPWLVLSPLQRRQLLGLVELADVVLAPVPAWRRMLGERAELVYVGSTLGEPAEPPEGGELLEAPVVFSPFAAGLRWDWIVAAVEAIGAEPALTVIGADWAEARRHHTAGRWAQRGWDWRGYLEGPAVLALLARARVVLAPFLDGLTGRRTSALAAGSVGTVVLSSRGPLFDPALEGGPFVVAGTKEEFVALAVELFGERGEGALGPGRGPRAARWAWYRERLGAAKLDGEVWSAVAG